MNTTTNNEELDHQRTLAELAEYREREGAFDPMTCTPLEMRRELARAMPGGYVHAYLQAISLERVSIDNLQKEASKFPTTSPQRGMIEGVLHARTIRAAATNGDTEKGRE